MKRIVLIASIIILAAGVLYWLTSASSVPIPGQKIEDLGRGHVDSTTEVNYNSNPPTSGPHDADWARPGVYESPLSDRLLVHSLEHGYIILSYNCDLGKTIQTKEGSPSAEIASSSAVPSQSEECKQLINQLSDLRKVKNEKKIIVVNRPNLDTVVAATAWGYLDKFNPLQGLILKQEELDRLKGFINTHWDQGPEKTME